MGGLVALVSIAGLISLTVGGLWYLAVGDLIGDKRTAATSAVAGALVFWILMVVAGARALVPGRDVSRSKRRNRRRHR
jgi:hypothetical protein